MHMPYEKNKDLPENVIHVLPPHAQDIYRAAFNSVWDEYSREEPAHKVAWSAVKKRYQKEGDKWVEKAKT